MTEISSVPHEVPAQIDVPPPAPDIPNGSNDGLDPGIELASTADAPDITAPPDRGRVIEWGSPAPEPVEAATTTDPAAASEIIDTAATDANTETAAAEPASETTAEPVTAVPTEPAAEMQEVLPDTPAPQDSSEPAPSNGGRPESPWSSPPDRGETGEKPREMPTGDNPAPEPPVMPAETPAPAEPLAPTPREVPPGSPWSSPPDSVTRKEVPAGDSPTPEVPPAPAETPEPAHAPTPGPWDTPPRGDLPRQTEAEPVTPPSPAEPLRPADVPIEPATQPPVRPESLPEEPEVGSAGQANPEATGVTEPGETGEDDVEQANEDDGREAGDVMPDTAEASPERLGAAEAAGELATGEAVELDDGTADENEETADDTEGDEAHGEDLPDQSETTETTDSIEGGEQAEGTEANETDTEDNADATDETGEGSETGESTGESAEATDEGIAGEADGGAESDGTDPETDQPADESAEPGADGTPTGGGSSNDPANQQQPDPNENQGDYQPRHSAEREEDQAEQEYTGTPDRDAHEDLRPPRPQHNRQEPRERQPAPPPPPPRQQAAAAPAKKAPPPIQRTHTPQTFGQRLGEVARDLAIGGPGKLIDNMLPHATARKATGHEAGFWRQQVTVRFMGSTRTYYVRGPRFVAGWVGRFRALFDW